MARSFPVSGHDAGLVVTAWSIRSCTERLPQTLFNIMAHDPFVDPPVRVEVIWETTPYMSV